MKKEINVLRILLLSAVVIVVLVSALVFFSLSNRVDYNQLIEVSIARSNGFVAVYDGYTLTQEDGNWVAIRHYSFPDNARKIAVDDAFVTKIKEILSENNVHKWDGFDKNLKYVYDATSVNFSMRFVNGKEITASGYATHPKNFYIVFEEFEKLFEELFSK